MPCECRVKARQRRSTHSDQELMGPATVGEVPRFVGAYWTEKILGTSSSR